MTGEADAESLLCLPFLLNLRPVGAFCLGREAGRDPFTSDDIETLHFLCVPILAVVREYIIDGLGPQDGGGSTNGDPIIGRGPGAVAIRAFIDKVKDLDAPVLITGESGTGKELVARTIHETGRAPAGPFVAVNCGAIPDALLESELFGHARGSFTGADARQGRAHRGGLGRHVLPGRDRRPARFALQAKLLRVLEEKEIRRVGETRTGPVDVRFVSATNKDLEHEVEPGPLPPGPLLPAEDHHHRPAAAARAARGRPAPRSTISSTSYSRDLKRERVHFSPATLELFLELPLAGQRPRAPERGPALPGHGRGRRSSSEEHLSPKINPAGRPRRADLLQLFEAKADFERRFLSQALVRCSYNKARTAAEIGLTRQGLFKLLKKHIEE